jgi:hypothetical protein
MPVTTRSQSKRLKNIDSHSSQVSSNATLLSSNNSVVVSVLPVVSTDVPTVVSKEILSNTSSSSYQSSLQPDTPSLFSGSCLETAFISNFEKFEISSGDLSFDPGIVHHNFSISKNIIMEADCEDVKISSSSSNGISDMSSLFDALSAKITSETSKLSSNFHFVANEHDLFKREVRAELDELRSLLLIQNSTKPSMGTSSAQVKVSSSPSNSASIVSTHISSQPAVASPDISSHDMQQKTMLMMTESFNKLSTAFSEGKQEKKAEWPKFSRDSKKFRAWYLGILTQLSLPPWQDLYDSIRHDVVDSTQNASLNGRLYSKIILALEGSAYKNFVSRKHLRANGVSLLAELVQTYKPRNVPELIAAKTVEFWGQMKRQPNESIDAYYDRFQELLEDLEDAEEPIATKAAIRQFIFTLGPEFQSIQNNFRINNLPSEWKTNNWPDLLTLCRDYYNSVTSHLPNRRLVQNQHDQNFDREEHQKKVKMWFMNPGKYCQEIENCQNRYPGRCIYHLAKSHPTEKCGVKKECDELVAGRKTSRSSGNNSSTPGQLRHLTEESYEEAEFEDVVEQEVVSGNDTNKHSLLYFARLSKHYLCLVKNSSVPSQSRHTMPFPVIADSGANYHMFRDQQFFSTMSPATGNVI